jgi:hypothetical protein
VQLATAGFPRTGFWEVTRVLRLALGVGNQFVAGRGRWRTLSSLAVLLAAGQCAAARAEVPTGFYGVNPGDLFALPASDWDAQLAALQAGGIGVVRLPAYWSDLEPRAPDADGRRYPNWQLIDDKVQALARHGLRWEPVICFSATWSETVPGDYASAPADAGQFAAFAATLARRYGPGGSFWSGHSDLAPVPVRSYELWNEPNAAVFWHPQDSAPEAYADLYALTRDALRQVDGSARVVVGGLASPGTEVLPADRFVARMFAHRPDLRGDVDVVGYHPYSATIAGVYALLAAFRRALDAAAGPGVPIEVTEVGWTSTETAEHKRAANLAALAATLPRSDCGIDRLMPYAWIGPEQDPHDRLQWFGIANRDGTARPSASAYVGTAKEMEQAAAPAGIVALCHPRLGLGLRAVTARDGSRPRLTVSSSCAAACALSLRVTAKPRGHGRTLARRTLRFARGRRKIRLLLSHRTRPGTRLAVRAHAWTRAGWRATRVRTVHVRQIQPRSVATRTARARSPTPSLE